MTISPFWIYDPANDRHILVAGDYQCRVWRATSGPWTAMISRQGVAVAHDHFPTLQDAQAWCEAQLDLLAKEDPHDSSA